jgi:hypothetical protein
MGQPRLTLANVAPVDPLEPWMTVFAADVVRAGYDAAEVDARWPDKLDRLLDTSAAFTRRLFTQAGSALMEVGDDRPLALHHALEVIVHGLVAAPELTYLSVVELPRRGAVAHALHLKMVALFGELLAGPHEPERPDALSTQFVAGAVWMRARRHAAARTLPELHQALPALSHVAVSTVFGRPEAVRVACLANEPGAMQASSMATRRAVSVHATAGPVDLTQPRSRTAASRLDSGTPATASRSSAS